MPIWAFVKRAYPECSAELALKISILEYTINALKEMGVEWWNRGTRSGIAFLNLEMRSDL